VQHLDGIASTEHLRALCAPTAKPAASDEMLNGRWERVERELQKWALWTSGTKENGEADTAVWLAGSKRKQR